MSGFAEAKPIGSRSAESPIYLRAGPGAFARGVIGGKTPSGSRTFIFARAQTWLHDDMLGPDQIMLARAAMPELSVAWDLWRWGQV